MLELLHELKTEKLISELDYQFAKMIDKKQQPYDYAETPRNLAVLLSALVSFNVMKGNTAVRLHGAAEMNLFDLKGKKASQERDFLSEIWQKIGKISPLEWQSALQNHIAFSQDPSQIAPMLFQNGLLYFYRYWKAENRVANYLQQAVRSSPISSDIEQDRAILAQLFPHKNPQIDWQKIAVATALTKNFCLISGGPGTGKTYTVARLLAALQLKLLKQDLPLLKIALAAPTGKAASRLKESISSSVQGLDLPQSLKDQMITEASTIHRLLGIRPLQDLPKYHQKNPLHIDLLVVDEASMIDLTLMEKLMNALKPTTKLVLLGDKDQLASVEVGSMMGDLGSFLAQGYSPAHCDYLRAVTGEAIEPKQANVLPICDSLCHLVYSRRFGEHSGIGKLARAVNAQQAVGSWQILNESLADLALIAYPEQTQFADERKWQQHCVAMVVDKAVELYRRYLDLVKKRVKSPEKVDVKAIFEAFQQVRLLSALRVGELGVERLNQTIAETLKKEGLIFFQQPRENYFGKPILITENSPQLDIFSGDIGIILPDEQGESRVYFNQGETTFRSISLNRLPEYEVAYVMTVHKSQGSEFDHTLLILPLKANPILTKELIYTAITRAKNQFTLFGNEKIWKQGVRTEIERQSGLREQLGVRE
ncbi:exodeoxyribonuclease V subunit alpha [Haemophilus paracuniculus]|uniref:RecBCD enzyme subunit RecD n=1 Tax=Haemophilus paracuniculus TaxID=734 RepID=A0A1T0AUZ4_9PAST|nr:exodeoxyribonuclease V subunit alpha [Haemophilus paracuniculus]OOS00328.1 exodeoxyribonuclease V subunit alpha [Haemophilus paracuniculus]